MPWICPACAFNVPSDVGDCPECGAGKSAWTIHADQTRALVVPRTALTAKPDPAPVLRSDHARALVAAGARPSDDQLLWIRATPGQRKDRSLALLVDYARRDPATVELPPLPPEPKTVFEIPVLLVRGDGALPSFDGIQVVDVTEAETRRGHAPSVEVSGLGKEPIELELLEVPWDDALEILPFDDVNFHTDGEIFLPAPSAENAGDVSLHELAGLPVVCAAVLQARRLPERDLMVIGHTDTSGSDSHNLALSQRRAENVHLYLSGQRERWAENCAEHDTGKDLQVALAWVAGTCGWLCHPGHIDGIVGSNTREALELFRESYDDEYGTSLAGSGEADAVDWGAFYDLFDVFVASSLVGEDEDLDLGFRSAFTFTDPPSFGCGEHWPVDAPSVDGKASALNRRVDLMFFGPGQLPDLTADAVPGASLYEERWRHTLTLAGRLLRENGIAVLARDDDDDPDPEPEIVLPKGVEAIPSGALGKIARKSLTWLGKRAGTVSNHIVARHISKVLVKWVGKTKFKGGINVKKLIEKTLKNPATDHVLSQGSRTVFQKEFKYAIGEGGQRFLRVVVRNVDGKIITAFPTRGFKVLTSAVAFTAIATAADNAEASMKDYFEEVERAEAAREARRGWIEKTAEWLWPLGYEPATVARDEDILFVNRLLKREIKEAQRKVAEDKGEELTLPEEVEIRTEVTMQLTALVGWGP